MITNIKLHTPNDIRFYLEYTNTDLKEIGEENQLLCFENLNKAKDFIKRMIKTYNH